MFFVGCDMRHDNYKSMAIKISEANFNKNKKKYSIRDSDKTSKD